MRTFDNIPVDLIERQFLNFLNSQPEGLRPRKELDQLKLDVKTRYQTKGDKGSETSAIYCVYTDGWPAGYVRSFRTDEYCEWSFDMAELRGLPSQKKLYDDVSSSEFKEYARQVQKDRQLREQAEGKQVLAEVQKAWRSAPPLQGCIHDYLRTKSVYNYGLREHQGQIMIPLTDINGTLKSIQFIKPSGEKRFFPDSESGGAFFAIELSYAEANPNAAILVCEGYATGATLHELTKLPVICAMNCGNMVRIAPQLRAKFKSNKIFAMGDNDAKTKGNPGLSAAEKCVTNGWFDGCFVPQFKQGDKGTDWNDYYNLYGQKPARDALIDWIDSMALPEGKREEFIKSRSLLRLGIGLDEKINVPPVDNVGGMFPKGYVSVLFAAPGSGKTFFMQKFASDLSLGGAILGGFCYEQDPRKTVIFAGEARSRMLIRRAKQTHWPVNPELVRIYDRDESLRQKVVYDLNTQEGLNTVYTILRAEKPDVVFFDSLMSFYTGDESKSDTLNAVLRSLSMMAVELDIAIVFTHHKRKTAIKDRGKPLTQDEAIGSSMLSRHTNCMISIEEMPGGINDTLTYADNKVQLVKTVKSWDRNIAPFTFRLVNDDSGRADMEFDLNPFRSERGNVKGKLWDFIEQNYKPGVWFKKGDLKSSGVSDRYLNVCLNDFVTDGKLNRRGYHRGIEYAIRGFYEPVSDSLSSGADDVNSDADDD